MPSLTKDENFNRMISKVLSRNYKDASPRDIKNAMDEITATVERIGSYKYPSPELEEAPKFLRELRRGLDQRLKDQVPEYRDAAERFAQYRSTYLEQPIAGGNDAALDDIYYGNMKKGEKKLVESYEDLVKRATGESQSVESTEERYAKLLQKAQEFQKAEQGRVASGKISAPITGDPKEFMQTIKDFADDAAVRRSVRQTQDSQAGGGIALKNAAGIANTGRGALLSASYLAGKASTGKIATNVTNLSRRIYNAPAQSLSNLATKLEATPGVSALGKALREGLENGDSAKRNAALFTIMQNPNSRLLISGEDFPDEEPME
jgi:aminopeptidase N